MSWRTLYKSYTAVITVWLQTFILLYFSLSCHVSEVTEMEPYNSNNTSYVDDDDDETAYFTVRWKTRASFVYRTKNVR